jgi:hypothetical protein
VAGRRLAAAANGITRSSEPCEVGLALNVNCALCDAEGRAISATKAGLPANFCVQQNEFDMFAMSAKPQCVQIVS